MAESSVTIRTPTTSLVAAGTTGSASLYPIITWAIGGFPQPVPEMTAVAIAAYVSIGIHLIGVTVCRFLCRYCPDLVAGQAPLLAPPPPAA